MTAAIITDAAALLSALRKGPDYQLTANAICDLLEESGRTDAVPPGNLRLYRSVKRRERWHMESLERACVAAGLADWGQCPCHMEGVRLHERLAQIDPATVPVADRARLYRTDRAAAARKVLKALRLEGISVTAPSYSMAKTVDVKLPKRLDVSPADDRDLHPDERCRVRAANWAARQKVEQILLAALPGTHDRSDSMTDYFDACWSIDD
jgi:hypothetical protein